MRNRPDPVELVRVHIEVLVEAVCATVIIALAMLLVIIVAAPVPV